ncbi:YlbD family protein [Fredinandcohnia sp. QZ13]|uniref:YlbD family protein n=1 Tax=Fredinandcohnia sp. QZ13 TaxID=3073144 RepID=UPI002853364B|nr:YlbD family protein [Fredinandcohnia sp. QZ13]MDR4886622.1 YlbD family protein [Fredinandcohnia sp. QZ13]
MGRKLHPSVQEFKAFVKKHPLLVQEVRKGTLKWQEVYEDWYILGEEDEKWNKFKDKDSKKEESGKGDFIGKIFSTIKNADMDNLQETITNVGEAISTIQAVIHQFRGNENQQQLNTTQKHHHPFAFRKD